MDTEALPIEEDYAIWGFGGTIAWGTVIALLFLLVQIITVAVYIVIEYGAIPSSEVEALIPDLTLNGNFLAVVTHATLLVCLPAILVAIKSKKRSNIRHYLGIQGADPKTIAYWLSLTLVLVLLIDLLTFFLGRPIVPEFMYSVYLSVDSPWFLWATLMVAAPLLEETFYRGFLFTGLTSSFLGPIGAIVLTSALWAAIHFQYDPFGVAAIFLMGLLLGTARLMSGSVVLTIGMHSLINLVATIEVAIYASSAVV